MGRPLLPQRSPLTPQPPLIWRLSLLLSILISPPSTQSSSSFFLSSFSCSYSSSTLLSNRSHSPPTSPTPPMEDSKLATPLPFSSSQTKLTSGAILQFNSNGILHSSGSQPFSNCGPVNAWRFYCGPPMVSSKFVKRERGWGRVVGSADR